LFFVVVRVLKSEYLQALRGLNKRSSLNFCDLANVVVSLMIVLIFLWIAEAICMESRGPRLCFFIRAWA
jgi:hypothetical protein